MGSRSHEVMLGLVLGQDPIEAAACRAQHRLGGLELRRRARVRDLARRGEDLVGEVAERDERVLALARHGAPRRRARGSLLAAGVG